MSKTKKKTTKKNIPVKSDFLDKIDSYFTRKQKIWFWVFFAIAALFTFLLFDLRVSVGGDDSAYIIRAHDLLNDFKYPSFQGPLYPIVLSFFIAIFGINLVVLKLISALFLLGFLYYFFKAFKNRIPNSIINISFILVSINAFLLYYGSQTYSETFFLFVQALFLIYFFKYFIEKDEPSEIKQIISRYVALGAIILSLGIIKSVGFSALFAVIIYFTLVKKWKAIGFSTLGFFVSFGIWKLIKMLLWSETSTQFSSQASTLFQVHPYDASKGMETFGGFIQRFLDNSNIYLSRQFLKVLGIRPELIEVNGQLTAAPLLSWLTITIYAVLIIAFIYAFRKNKYLLFTGVYLAMLMGITFILLQTLWEGTRLIMIFLPLLILYLIAGIYYLLKIKKLKILQIGYLVIAAILFFSTISTSKTRISDHQKVFRSHLKGRITAGMTPDWVNYINMCKWADKNVPKDKFIASRKPSIAFVYTGRRFHGIYKVPNHNPDSLLNKLYERDIDYVVMASLRKVEAKKTKYTINTIQRYLYYIQQKYPEKLRVIHQIGADEPAYLFKIER